MGIFRNIPSVDVMGPSSRHRSRLAHTSAHADSILAGLRTSSGPIYRPASHLFLLIVYLSISTLSSDDKIEVLRLTHLSFLEFQGRLLTVYTHCGCPIGTRVLHFVKSKSKSPPPSHTTVSIFFRQPIRPTTTPSHSCPPTIEHENSKKEKEPSREGSKGTP